MFQEMFQHCSSNDGTKEIPMENVSIETIQTFQNILDKNSVKPAQITLDLYKFADKFDIQPLVRFCGDYLGTEINMENVFETALVAHLVRDDSLLKKIALFLTRNSNPEVKNFFKRNPEIGSKLFESML